MMVNNEDGTYMVQYTPEDTGPYAVNVEFEGKPVPGSPFKTTAIPTGDANKCRITGMSLICFFNTYHEKKFSK